MTDILDIKPLLKLELFWVWVLLAVLCLAVLYGLYRVFRKKKKEVFLPPVPIRVYSPRELALKSLQELDALQLLEHGQFRKYYFRASEILKHFLEDEFKIQAVDTTTEEIHSHLQKSEFLSASEKTTVEKTLREMDLVKFAKLVPSQIEIRHLREELGSLFKL